MALKVPKAPGFAQMLKEGAKHMQGMEEAVYTNIEACSELAKTTRTSFGPSGQNKMVINHIEKLFVTSDAATILRELDIVHPAAKLLAMASKQQEEECGDGTNLTLIFAGALLERAEGLLRLGLSVSEVIAGYELALAKATELLTGDEKSGGLCCGRVTDLSDRAQIRPVLRSAVASKVPGYEDFLADLVVDACVPLLSRGGSFSVDSVRVTKIPGAGLLASSVVRGMLFVRQVESVVQAVDAARVAVYSCPLDSLQTETKGTVLINTAQQLMDYSKGEESLMEQQLKAIADAGVNVIVSGGKVGDLALHYANQYNLMIVRLTSKFDVRRLCRVVGATALPHIVAPTPAEIGRCDRVYVDEIGDTACVVFRQEDAASASAVSTIVIRGSTAGAMDDMERAVDDAVNTYKSLTRDPRLVAGAGATEIELAAQLSTYAETRTGLDQYAVAAYGLACESVCRALADNAGLDTQRLLAELYAAHRTGPTSGLDLSKDDGGVCDAKAADIYDVLMTKVWALKYGTVAACTVLSVDQIIMAKPAGQGPKPKENKHWDDD